MNFCKMNGAGNDFIIIDNRTAGKSEKELSALAAHLCERRMSIGADGLIAVDTARLGGDFRMRFFNSDGSAGEMCGNGARCICRYGCENGLAGEVQRVETDAGMIEGMRLSQREYRVLMGSPSRVDFDIDVVVYDAHAGCRRVYKCDYVELGNPGVPHAVVECKGLREMVTRSAAGNGCFGSGADSGFEPCGSAFGFVFRGADEESVSRLREAGRAIRHAACFQKGANVNFFEFMEDGRIFEVTFERGVEDFTYACGSGSASCAIVLALRGRLPKCRESSSEIRPQNDRLQEKDCDSRLDERTEHSNLYTARLLMRGGELHVDVELAAETQNANAEMLFEQRHVPERRGALARRVYLSGPTNMVASGCITDDDLPK